MGAEAELTLRFSIKEALYKASIGGGAGGGEGRGERASKE
jgi:phosphopantetheinyl transferase (holo-ACP synthase)